MIRQWWSILMPCLMLLASCQDNIVEEAEIIPEDQRWTYDQPVRLDFEVGDTASLYDLTVEVTHTASYAWENLYIRIHNAFPDGDTLSRNVSLELADKKGRWQGDCSGEICRAVIDLQSNFFFPMAGSYSIWAEQYMRRDSLEGIEAIRLLLSRTRT